MTPERLREILDFFHENVNYNSHIHIHMVNQLFDAVAECHAKHGPKPTAAQRCVSICNAGNAPLAATRETGESWTKHHRSET